MTSLSVFEPGVSEREPASLETAKGQLPLRAVSVRARIVGTTADVDVEQTFENVFDETLEVSYVFPLPDLAAVTRCELHVGGRVVVAKLQERGAARETYEKAIEAGQRAALAEQERPGVFTTTLGNLAPGERATVRFGMAYLLPREDGRHVFRFPLVVGERYIAGTPLEGPQVGDGVERDTTDVPDASRVSPPRLAPSAERPQLAIEAVLVHGDVVIDEIECSLHASSTEQTAGTTIVRLAPDQPMDRDFVLRFRLGGDAVRSQLVLCRDASTGEPYRDPAAGTATFQLTLVPPLAKLKTRPRDVVLILDRSGSMAGWKIVAARRALVRMVDVLDDADRFAVYAFGSHTVACADLAFDRLHPASAANRARVTEMLGGISADGGTEMLQPLQLATELLAHAESGRDPWIVLVTDGQVANEDPLVRLASSTPHAKVLCLGIDDAVNGSLLRRLAQATGGRVELVQQESELEDALHRLHVLIAAPVVEHVTVEADGIVAGTIVPAGPLHMFPGVPLIVRGRCSLPLDAVRVRGRIGREPFDATVRAPVSSVSTTADVPALRACWAREQLLALEDQFAIGRVDRATLANEITATSLRYGVLCRFTAFVAVDVEGSPVTPATRSMQQPVEAAGGPLPVIAPRATVELSRYGSDNGSGRNTRTMAGTIRGKLSYLTPEQGKGLPIHPPHAVFGVARLVWELLTAERLFTGNSDFEILSAIVTGKLPPSLLSGTVPALEKVLRRALSVDPAARHATPGDLADALAAAHPAATLDEIAAWLATIDPVQLSTEAALLARAAAAQPPVRGYFLLARHSIGGEHSSYVGARAGASGNEAVLYTRLNEAYAEDPDHVERFLSIASVALDGLGRIDDCGVDNHGGVFRAMRFIHGIDLMRILRVLTRANAGAPPAIAVGIMCAAARALEAALHLPGGSGGLGVLVRELAPSALRIGVDGLPVWVDLPGAPSADFTAPRRTPVKLALAPGIALRGNASPSALWSPLVSRFVVVPRNARVRLDAAPSEPAQRPRRKWMRWWRDD